MNKRKLCIYMMRNAEDIGIGIGSENRRSRIVLTSDQACHLAHRLMSYAKGGAAPYKWEEWEQLSTVWPRANGP